MQESYKYKNFFDKGGVNVKMFCHKEDSSLSIEDVIHKVGKSLEKVDIYIDLDDTIFDLNGKIKEIKSKTGMNFPQAEYGFFANLEPLPRAIEVVKKLMNDKRYNVRFATAPSILNPMSYTEKMMSIKKYFGIEGVEKLIIIREKDILDRTLSGIRTILIDDLDYGYGQENFTEQLVFGSNNCKNWTDVENILLK